MLHRTILAAAVFASVASAQLSVVIPAGTATVEGNSSNAFPWGRGGTGLLLQCVYDSSHFTSQGVNFPIIITGMRWRPNTNVALAATGYGQASVALSTCPLDYSGLSTTLASNHGPDLTTVYSGPVAWAAQAAQVGPAPFGIVVPFTSNFLYDPTQGDLNIEVDLPIQSPAPAAFQLDVQSTGAAATRVYVSTGYPGTGTGIINTNHGVVVQVDYQPAAGLYPGFNASTTTPALNSPVNFTDATFTSDPQGVLAWAWDVDGDSVVDYTTQNCSHGYPTEGRYDVTLTVVDATHGTRTLTRTQYIGVDLVAADFTVQQLPNRLVIFSDTSAGNPATWAWDVDGDNVVDYTGQNAAHVYPAAGAYNVTLTVTDAISTSSKTVNLGIDIIPVPGFGSTFASTAATRGFWFQAPVKFSIVSALVPNEANETLQNAAIYRLTAPPPTFSATATGGFEWAGIGQPANTPMACAVSFDVGEYVGVLGACGSTTMRNSYGTPAGPFATSVLGVPTTLTRMGTQFNLFSNPPETLPYFQEPTGALSRVILGVTAAAGIPYGTGTPSGAGPAAPRMRCTALPFVGGTTTLAVEQGDSNVLGFMVGGFGRTSIPTPFGEVLVANQVLTQLITPGIGGPGTFTFSWNVPNLPTLIGFDVNFQYAQLVTTSNQIALSNGVELSFAQ